MAFIIATGPRVIPGPTENLQWVQDRETLEEYSVGDTVLTLSETPVDENAIDLYLNNGPLTFGTDWTLSGLNVIIQFDKAPDGTQHYFLAKYPFAA